MYINVIKLYTCHWYELMSIKLSYFHIYRHFGSYIKDYNFKMNKVKKNVISLRGN